MAITDTQYMVLLERVTALEEAVNNLSVASQHYVSRSQVQQLLTLLSTDLADVKVLLDSLKNRVVAIEEEALN